MLKKHKERAPKIATDDVACCACVGECEISSISSLNLVRSHNVDDVQNNYIEE